MKVRNKTVVFRITPEEHGHLKSACSEQGARSLSEFARSRVLRAVGQPPFDPRMGLQLTPWLAETGRKLDELESAVQRLSQALKAP